MNFLSYNCFINEAFDNPLITQEEFEKIKKGDSVSFKGSRYTVEENSKVVLSLKSVNNDKLIKVNYSQFKEGGRLV